MKTPTKAGVAVIAAILTVFGVLGIAATAQTDGVSQSLDVPEGPSINYCPTTEQIEAHLKEFGFDYKPTVVCGENGVELGPSTPVDTEAAQATEAIRKSDLMSATRAPDTDGDPLTMEIILKDGTEATINIDGDPKIFKDMTPAELAKVIYP